MRQNNCKSYFAITQYRQVMVFVCVSSHNIDKLWSLCDGKKLAILPSHNIDKHGVSAGKQLVAFCLHCMIVD